MKEMIFHNTNKGVFLYGSKKRDRATDSCEVKCNLKPLMFGRYEK